MLKIYPATKEIPYPIAIRITAISHVETVVLIEKMEFNQNVSMFCLDEFLVELLIIHAAR